MTGQKKQVEHDREAGRAIKQRANLSQQRDEIRDASKQAVAERHPQERARLEQAHQALRERAFAVAPQATADRQRDEKALERFERAQDRQLTKQQELEQEVTERLGHSLNEVEQQVRGERGKLATDDGARLSAGETESRHRAMRESMGQLAQRVLNEVRNTVAATQARLDRERDAMAHAVANQKPGRERERAVGEAVRAAERAAVAVARQGKGLLTEIDRGVALEQGRMTDSQFQRTRDAIEQQTGVRISNEIIQRMADEARTPGSRALSLDSDKQRAAAVDRAKGQLAEELLGEHARREAAIENQKRPLDRQLHYVAGDRIRNSAGKLTDGVLAWQDEQKRLRVWKAYEAKAGAPAARELNQKIEEMTHTFRRETALYARDLALEKMEKRLQKEGPTLRVMTEEERGEVQASTERHEEQLMSRRTQAEAGQQAQTTERLDVEEQIRLDGRTQEIALDRERVGLGKLVQKVVPQDVMTEDREALHLDVRAEQLQRAAETLLEELRCKDEQ